MGWGTREEARGCAHYQQGAALGLTPRDVDSLLDRELAALVHARRAEPVESPDPAVPTDPVVDVLAWLVGPALLFLAAAVGFALRAVL